MINSVIEKLGRLKNQFFSGIFYLAGLLLIMISLAAIGYQLFLYLQNGSWTSMQLRIFLQYSPYPFYAWVLNPESWLGLHKAVTWLLGIPLAFACFILGYLLIKFSDFLALFSD